jgi:ribonuclease Z
MLVSMWTLFDHHLVNDSFGDPSLFVDFRDERRALLFDIGDIRALPPRQLLRLSQVFVTHTHMDHFSGFDHWLAVVLARKAHVTLHGGPNFIAQVEHKLRAYTWNVVHRYAVALEIEVCEVHPDGERLRARFSSRTAFGREDLPTDTVTGDVLHEELTFRVRARFMDHEMPCLAFALEEKATVRVAADRLEAMGVTTGAWLRELKHAVLTNAPGDTPINMEWNDAQGAHAMTRTLDELRHLVLDVGPGQRIGYVTDLRFTEANVQALVELLQGVDVLYIESVFMEADAAHARRKNHLTARQAGEIARRVGAKALVPMHHSPRYEGRAEEVVKEAMEAWRSGR